MLNLNKLERQLDEALAKETPESLTEWLREKSEFKPPFRGKTLHLTLKKKWFDMVASGEKMEEYREIKQYWIIRMFNHNPFSIYNRRVAHIEDEVVKTILSNIDYFVTHRIKKYDLVEFKNGYSKAAPSIIFELRGIEIREGKPEWGAEKGKKYFVLKLGALLEKNF